MDFFPLKNILYCTCTLVRVPELYNVQYRSVLRIRIRYESMVGSGIKHPESATLVPVHIIKYSTVNVVGAKIFGRMESEAHKKGPAPQH
jgi:hypothetical protein